MEQGSRLARFEEYAEHEHALSAAEYADPEDRPARAHIRLRAQGNGPLGRHGPWMFGETSAYRGARR